jgi:hypothetical protein
MTAKEMGINVELLLKVKERILAEPSQFDMRDWRRSSPECGTVACIAGWACAIADAEEGIVPTDYHQIESRAEILLGERAIALFYASCWPDDLCFAEEDASVRSPEYAAVAAQAIDRFIASPEEFGVEGF